MEIEMVKDKTGCWVMKPAEKSNDLRNLSIGILVNLLFFGALALLLNN